MSEIANAAFDYQIALEKGDKKVVGVNCHTESVSHELEILRVSHEVERDQVAALGGAQGRPRRRGREPPRSRAWSRSPDVGEHGPRHAGGGPRRGHAR